MKNEHQSDAQAFILCGLFKYMHKHKQTGQFQTNTKNYVSDRFDRCSEGVYKPMLRRSI